MMRCKSGPTSIERLARQRQVTLTSNLKPGFSQSDVLAKMNQGIAAMKMPPEYVTQPAGNAKELALRYGKDLVRELLGVDVPDETVRFG